MSSADPLYGNYPSAPAANNTDAYTSWDDEYNWFKPRAQQHVKSRPFLYGKVSDSDIHSAFDTYNRLRPTLPNRGDAFNQTLDELGWWTGAPTYNAPPPEKKASGKTRTGNAQNDFMSLTNGLPATTQSLASIFPQFSEWYPGSSFEKADVTGPGFWADTIGNVGSPNAHWQWYTGSGQSGKNLLSGYSPQFSDPLTKQYEQLLKSQTSLYQKQQAKMQQEAAQQAQVRAQTDAAVKRLMAFINQRVDTLQQPAYTDSESNIIKTRLLDPLEADRGASQQRALNNVGSRGFDPSSGIAQQMFQDIDREYDKSRSRVHGDVAYEQIQEQRSREQEAQELLKYLTQLPMASARGDLDFVNYLDNLVSQPGERALGTSALSADLPVQRTQLALQTLGLGGQPINSINGVMALLNNSTQNRLLNQQNNNSFWSGIGESF